MSSSVIQLVAAAAGASGAAQTRAAARLMTLLENQPHRLPELFQKAAGGEPGVKSAARDLNEFSWPQSQMVLGITGSPGAGKSTLTDTLVAAYRGKFPNRRVGVIAVDPSSPFTGGAVLGDRVRMMRHATDPMVFVRSLATRGHLGGLSLGVRGVLHVMALIGCELVIIETVGVGQSEVEIANVADLTAIIFAPGQGDSIQLLKAGLMEIGDLFVVNKADRQGADELHAQLLAALKLGMVDAKVEDCGHHHTIGLPKENVEQEPTPSAEIGLMRSGQRGMPDVFLVSAAEARGIPELVDGLESLTVKYSELWKARRRKRIVAEIRDAILEDARQRIDAALGSNGSVEAQARRILAGEVTIGDLATELLHRAGENTVKSTA